MERWEIINAVKRMQNYIEGHITEPISLNQQTDFMPIEGRASPSGGYTEPHKVNLIIDIQSRMRPFLFPACDSLILPL